MKEVKQDSLTKEEFQILTKVSGDVFLFSTYCWVINPVKGKVRFLLYPFQKAVLYNFLKNRFNIILKFRQAGITELIAMYCLWLCMYHPNKKVNIISIKDITAKKVLKKIKFMYKNLPEYLQVPIVNGRPGEYGSSQTMEFSNGSFVESIPTSPEAGRSESLSLLVIDEAAMVRWAGDIWAAALPTISCTTGDSQLFFKTSKRISIKEIKEICPKEKGITLVKGLKTLTHTGQWKKVLLAQNKGELETWWVRDNQGNTAGYTPKHKLLTPQGWKTLEEIIQNNLSVIQVDTQISKLEEKPQTELPKKEEKRNIPEFPGYQVSNFGKVYKNNQELSQRKSHCGYLRVYLTKEGEYRTTGSKANQKKHKLFPKAVHGLVAEAFLGERPEGYQVDHIDCNRTHNWSTNLQWLTPSENVKRTFQHNLSAKLLTITGSRLPDLLKRGKILELSQQGKTYYQIGKEIYPNNSCGNKFVKRILNERNLKSRVYLSKLEVYKKSLETIYDIQVEDDHSYIMVNNFVNHNTGGQAIVNSTPKGSGGWFHSQWTQAINQTNGFNPIRLHWYMHPERDEHWYATMSKALGPRRTAQEIDGDFLSSGSTVFDLADIRAIEESLNDYPVIKTKLNGQWRQFLEPKYETRYFIGADVATGRSNDYSSFTCMDKRGEEQVVYKGRLSVDQYARLLGDTGQLFNWATLAPESNDVGLAVTSLLQSEGYPNLYYYRKLIAKKGSTQPEVDRVPGWLTTNKNRSVIIEALEKDVREGNIIVKDPFFVNEAYTFIYDSTNRPVAMGKHSRNIDSEDIETEVYSDDDIFGKAITNHIRKGKDQIITLPQ